MPNISCTILYKNFLILCAVANGKNGMAEFSKFIYPLEPFPARSLLCEVLETSGRMQALSFRTSWRLIQSSQYISGQLLDNSFHKLAVSIQPGKIIINKNVWFSECSPPDSNKYWLKDFIERRKINKAKSNYYLVSVISLELSKINLIRA